MTTPTPTPPPVIVQVPGEWAWRITCSKCQQEIIVYAGTKREACINFVNNYPAGMIDLKRNVARCGSC